MIAKKIDKNTIEVFDLGQFDAYAIMHSGQVFRYFEKEGGYDLVVGKNFANLQTGKSVLIKCSDADFFWNYFDLDTDYEKIKEQLSVFPKIAKAIEAGGGIRILRANFEETVLSFIISANNNIKRFTKTLNLLAQKYGTKLANGLYSFPDLNQLANAGEVDYKEIGCGYRSEYLVKAVRQLASIDVGQLSLLDLDSQKKEILQICGVGPKVCACVQLFSGELHRLDVLPQDTWIIKAMKELGEDKQALLTHKYAGVAQQYIFYYFQHLGKNLIDKI